MAEQDLNAIDFPKLDEEQMSDVILQAFIARRQVMRQSGDFVGLRWRCALRLSQARRLAVGEGSMSVQFVHEFLKSM